jgi:HPt (histidine-containing phosphotransfer) domain-containing protein
MTTDQIPTRPCSATAETLVIDTAGALARLANMRNLYADLVPVFLQDLSQCCERYRQAWQADDRTEAIRQMHTLKGSAATLGATDLSQLARTLEQCCKNPGNAAPPPAQYAQLQAMIDATASALTTVLHTLQGRP